MQTTRTIIARLWYTGLPQRIERVNQKKNNPADEDYSKKPFSFQQKRPSHQIGENYRLVLAKVSSVRVIGEGSLRRASVQERILQQIRFSSLPLLCRVAKGFPSSAKGGPHTS